jgi:lipid II isoglutaminyl synthase (glutamine-hydrolysing)
VSAASRRLGLGGGSVIGGRVGLLVAPDLLRALASNRTVVLVSGTNGKTTTTRLLAAALGGPGRVATSSAGANLPPGLAVALAALPPPAPAVLEVDEAYLGRLAQTLGPAVVVLLNLSRDQLDRVGEVRMVAQRWRGALATVDTAVVANADDPLVAWAAGTAAKVTWVAAGLSWRDDAAGCPSCDGRITFAAEGEGWSCDCGFSRPQPELRLLDAALVTADGRRLGLRLALPGRANRANAAMAMAATGILGVDEAVALESMASVGEVEGRFAIVDAGGVRARLLLAKNPAGWTEVLGMLQETTGPVVIGINARVADGHDPSWLWDVPFERLAGRLVVATGERHRDLAVRLRYGGVEHMTVPDQLEALRVPGVPEVQYVGNYTAFQQLRRAVVGGPKTRPTGPGSSATVVPAPEAAPARGGGPKPSALRVVVIFPDLLGTYGDGGNGRVLAARAAWRGLPVELVLAASDLPLPGGGDIYCVGGGEDGPQIQAAQRLRASPLEDAVAGGATVLAVCAGFQIMGRSFPGADGHTHDGVGLLDVVSVRGGRRRAVGELVVDADDGPGEPSPGRLTGYENHASITRLGPGVRPLGRVLAGVGNGDGSGTDGARLGRVIGTYLHGPVLARNPKLADLLLGLATGMALDPLDDDEEQALHRERLAAVSRTRGGRPRLPRVRTS